MKRLFLAMMGGLALALPVLLLAADKPAAKEAAKGPTQTTCPLTGKPIDKNVSVKHDGADVYFCCKGCSGKFEKEPAKYMPAVYRAVYPQAVQVSCPVMGGEIDPEVFVEKDGHRVYFCCKGCDEKFTKEPAKYMDKLAKVTTGQVHCPISGKAINPAATYKGSDGKSVYFCCENCLAKYKEDPAKFADALKPTAGLVAYGPTAKEDLVICPTCAAKGGIHKRSEVKPIVCEGMVFGTCNDDCAKAFKAEPAKHIKEIRVLMVKQLGEGKWYTCAMHPAVLDRHEGKCPACDMKLTPLPATN